MLQDEHNASERLEQNKKETLVNMKFYGRSFRHQRETFDENLFFQSQFEPGQEIFKFVLDDKPNLLLSTELFLQFLT